MMDNILITSSEEVARSYALKTWSERNKVHTSVSRFNFLIFSRQRREFDLMYCICQAEKAKKPGSSGQNTDEFFGHVFV